MLRDQINMQKQTINEKENVIKNINDNHKSRSVLLLLLYSLFVSTHLTDSLYVCFSLKDKDTNYDKLAKENQELRKSVTDE